MASGEWMSRLSRTFSLCVLLIAVVALAGAVAPASGEPEDVVTSDEGSSRAVHFVVDVSGSMSGSRLAEAKSALRVGVAALEASRGAGLRSFAGSCSNGGVLRVPIGVDNRDALNQQIEALVAGGGTPTPAALQAAAGDFPAGLDERVIVLISDGQSTCGDPCPVAAQIAADDEIAFTAYTVGFNAPDSAESELACIAEVTGGTYVSASDEQGLISAIEGALGGARPGYVAVGDSTTTGFSVPTCDGDRQASEYGCTGQPPAPPYPERIAAAEPQLDPLDRKGIWGDTIARTIAAYDSGQNAPGETWEPQLQAAVRARDLVTVSLGANDMQWSDIQGWLSNCVGVPTRQFFGREIPAGGPRFEEDACIRFAREKVDGFADDMDRLFDVLEQPAADGAQVVITQYFNPYNETRYVERRFLPDGERDCSMLHSITDVVVGTLNNELRNRADERGFTTVDLRGPFEGKGAGSRDPYVFGSDCETRGAVSSIRTDISVRERRFDVRDPSIDELAARFDPHPNAAGTAAQAQAIREVLR